MKTILVKVTRADIRNGKDAMSRKKRRSFYCPLAQALHRVDGFKLAIVWPSRILHDGKSIFLTKAVQRFIARFDTGKPVQPFSFRLRVK